MWLSSTAQQAIHAVLCIADNANDDPVRVDEIAAVLGCPRNYLSKTLHILTRAGVLRSVRGPRGGFRLAVAADRLTLAKVVAPFEPIGERRCLLGRPTCGDANPCAAHRQWRKVSGSMDDFFRNTTVAALLRGSPPAVLEAREVIASLRLSNAKRSHGSVA